MLLNIAKGLVVICFLNKNRIHVHSEPVFIINDPPNYKRSPSINNVIGTIDILDEIHVEFDFIIHSWHSQNYSLLHFGNEDSERFPDVWLDGEFKTLYASFSLINNPNPEIICNAINLTLGTSYHFYLFQTQNHLSIKLQDIIIFDEYSPSHSIVMNRNMYLSDPWRPAADCTVYNLLVTTSTSSNAFNYNCDAMNRWETISGSWILSQSDCRVQQTNVSARGAVIWLGGYDPSSILWTDYSIEIKLCLVGYNADDYRPQLGMLIRSQSISPHNDGGQQYWIGAEFGWEPPRIAIGLMDDGWSAVYHHEEPSLRYLTNHTLRVEITGGIFKIYLDGAYLFTLDVINTQPYYAYGSVALRTFLAAGIFYDVQISHSTDGYLLTVPPTISSSDNPTDEPSATQTAEPSPFPSDEPSQSPSEIPTFVPSFNPIETTTAEPSDAPTDKPNVDTKYTTTTSLTQNSSSFTFTETDSSHSSDRVHKSHEANDTLLYVLLSIVGVLLIISFMAALFFFIYVKNHKRQQSVDEMVIADCNENNDENANINFESSENESNVKVTEEGNGGDEILEHGNQVTQEGPAGLQPDEFVVDGDDETCTQK